MLHAYFLLQLLRGSKTILIFPNTNYCVRNNSITCGKIQFYITKLRILWKICWLISDNNFIMYLHLRNRICIYYCLIFISFIIIYLWWSYLAWRRDSELSKGFIPTSLKIDLAEKSSTPTRFVSMADRECSCRYAGYV